MKSEKELPFDTIKPTPHFSKTGFSPLALPPNKRFKAISTEKSDPKLTPHKPVVISPKTCYTLITRWS